jgi:hypothetical protein
MSTATQLRADYIATWEMIAESLKAQGYTNEDLRQYNLDRDKGLSDAEAMKQLHRSSAA